MGSVPILSVKRSVSIGTMINFDGHGGGDGTCKQALTTGIREFLLYGYMLNVVERNAPFPQIKSVLIVSMFVMKRILQNHDFCHKYV